MSRTDKTDPFEIRHANCNHAGKYASCSLGYTNAECLAVSRNAIRFAKRRIARLRRHSDGIIRRSYRYDFS